MSTIKFASNASGSGSVTIASPNTNSDVTLSLPNDNGTLLYANSSGNVGIGTSSPAHRLDIRSASTPTIRVQETGSGGDKRLELSVNTSGVATVSAPQSAQVLTFNTVGSERVRIDSLGRVGINNSSPAVTLSVTGVPRITSPNFSFSTIDKEVNSSTGIVDFTFSETTGSGTADNVSGVVIISLYQPNTSIDNKAAGYVGLRIIPRGSGGTLVQIASQKGSGINIFTVSTNSDGIRVTTDTLTTLRCRLITLGGGGISVPSE